MSGISAKPIMEFKVGAVRASIWKNARFDGTGRSFDSHKVLVERTYKDRDGFKSTSSLDLNDIPKAILALKQAYEYILCEENRQGRETVEATVPYSPQRRVP